MEQGLIKLLLKQEFYSRISGFVKPELFGGVLRQIASTIMELQEKYKTDLTLEQVRTIHLSKGVPTRAQRALINSVMDSIETEADLNLNLAADYAQQLTWKAEVLRIGESASMLLNKESVTEEEVDELRETVLSIAGGATTEVARVDTGSDALLAASLVGGSFKFGLQPLQDATGGAGPGNLIVVFARPEVGKTALTTSLVAGFLDPTVQGRELKVAYMGNEEPGTKVGLSILRAITGKSDMELKDDYAKGKAKYPDWDSVRSRLDLCDISGMSVEQLRRYAEKNKPDVLIADQIDKFRISGEFSGDHSRLKEVYVITREIAKRNNLLMINVSQASAEAEGRMYLHYSMLDNSKTGKAGEADLIVGIGKREGTEDDGMRYLNLSKNKLNGNHATITVNFDHNRNHWYA